jgi:hypothetical protein
MAYRKKVENWLERDCEFWGVDVELIDSSCTRYVWHITCQNTVYEISYSDKGELAMNSLPAKIYPKTEIREIYVGDNSEISYRKMISLLSDNFLGYQNI